MLPQFIKSYFLGKFFFPDKYDYGSPGDLGLASEEVYFPAKTGDMLHGTFLKPSGPARGTVLQCHGNSGNVTSQYSLMVFLVMAGYNVLVFDYEGYGKSKGRPSPEKLIENALAALTYLRTRKDVDPKKIALFGQSLGGSAAAGAMEKDSKICCLILEGAFPSYLEMARETLLGKLLFFLTPHVIPDVGVRYHLKNFGGRPVLIIHGEEDGVVPVKFAPVLHSVNPAHSTLLILKNFHHLEGPQENLTYQKTVIDFLNKHV